MITLTIEFIDGTTRTLKGYRVSHQDGVLRIRTSHSTAYTDTWEMFPLTGIKTWRTE